MVWNVTANNQSHLHSNTKRKWRTSYFVDLPALNFTASCHFLWVQESPSELRILSELPSESAQQPHSTIDVALVGTMFSSAHSATTPFPAISWMVCSAPREQGFWEKDVCLLWRSMGRIYSDWEDSISSTSEWANTHLVISAKLMAGISRNKSPSCSHRSLFHLVDQQKIIFALCQMSPWSSLLLLLRQSLPRPR